MLLYFMSGIGRVFPSVVRIAIYPTRHSPTQNPTHPNKKNVKSTKLFEQLNQGFGQHTQLF